MNAKKIQVIASLMSLLLIFLLLSTSISQACSGFMVTHDDTVLIAHNKDWWSPDTTIHVYPADQEAYARLFFEIPYPHLFNKDYKVLAGGINEYGLCYESFVTPFKLASFELFKPPLFENPVDYILQHFTTVQEVIDYLEDHNLFFLNYILCSGQIFLVDDTGDAAIIEGDDIIKRTQQYQICTNFLQSTPNLGGYPCWRYQFLQESLENMTNPSISHFETLLDHVHQLTQYSWIINPNNNTLYLYHFSHFDNKIILNLTEEFNQPAHSYYLPSLFEPEHNMPPEKPSIPAGPTLGTRGSKYLFEINASDRDNTQDELYYKWNFGDGSQTNWIHHSEIYGGQITYAWKQPGIYSVTVKARDIYGKESPWSDPLEIQINRPFQSVFDLLFS